MNAAPAAPVGLAGLAGLPQPSAILFDLDGTLVDTVRFRIEAWHRALYEVGVDVDRDTVAGFIGSDGRWLATQVSRLVGRDLDPETADVADRLSGRIFDELNTEPMPLPGAGELLAGLEASGLTFAIATSSLPGQIQASVKALALPFAPAIVDQSHVARAKPEPDLLLEAASQLGVPPRDCWYVGDSTWDMRAARAAGMAGVGVPSGAVGPHLLLDAGATVTIESLHELLAELVRRGLVSPGSATDRPGAAPAHGTGRPVQAPESSRG